MYGHVISRHTSASSSSISFLVTLPTSDRAQDPTIYSQAEIRAIQQISTPQQLTGFLLLGPWFRGVSQMHGTQERSQR